MSTEKLIAKMEADHEAWLVVAEQLEEQIAWCAERGAEQAKFKQALQAAYNHAMDKADAIRRTIDDINEAEAS
jgi:hypothetical protein